MPARTIYDEDASSIGAGPSIVYGLKTVTTLGKLLLHRSGIVKNRKFMP